MNKSHRDIKGETFNRGVPKRTFKRVGEPNKHFTRPTMIQRILRQIKKPFTSKPDFTKSIERIGDTVTVRLKVSWWVLDVKAVVKVDTGLDGDQFGVQVRLYVEDQQLINEDISV